MNTDNRAIKDALFEQFARIGKAMANPHRLELLDVLAQGERRVEDIANETGLSVANASQHLQVLRRTRLVESRREGTAIYYRLGDDNVFRLWQALRGVGEARLPDVDHLVQSHVAERADASATISSTMLMERLMAKEVILLDVRPAVEYRVGHIPGARSIPIDELDSRFAELPKDREVIAYCRGPYCFFADDAVALLRQRGYRARRLDIGLPDWRVSGLPTASN